MSKANCNPDNGGSCADKLMAAVRECKDDLDTAIDRIEAGAHITLDQCAAHMSNASNLLHTFEHIMSGPEPEEFAPGDMALTVQIVPCLLGFDVRTYNARLDGNGSWYGVGFKRQVGIFDAHTLIQYLIWTEDPFRVVVTWKP